MSSTAKSDAVYVAHMLECIWRVQSYTVQGQQHFRQSTLIQDAVIRNLQIMAESSQKLSQATKERYPNIPWRAISGFRNIIVHDYLGLDLDVVWSVVENELPPLKNALSLMRLEN